MSTVTDDSNHIPEEVARSMAEFNVAIEGVEDIAPKLRSLIIDAARYVMLEWWETALATDDPVKSFRMLHHARSARLVTSLTAMMEMLMAMGDGLYDEWAKKILSGLN